MEFTPEKCKKKHRKDVNLFDDLLHICSQSSLSSGSEASFRFFKVSSKKSRRGKDEQQGRHKRDYLSRLLERKRLKEKSLSKKMKTPFDRKLNRTSWPIELGKVSKIKKKPREKSKKKPTHRSLRRKKFSNPTFISKGEKLKRSSSVEITCSESECENESFSKVYQYYCDNPFIYESVTPQMLVNVLQDPEHLNTGATLDMIIAKLRALKVDLNPSLDPLREEVTQKLDCAIKLGWVVENNGYYRIGENFQTSKLGRKKLDAFWELWYRKMTCIMK